MTLDVMGVPAVPRPGPEEPAVTRHGPAGSGVAVVVFCVVVAAWVVALVRGMDTLPRDSSVARWLVAWVLVETAVLLPGIFPVSRADLRSLPYRTAPAERFARGLALVCGYLLAWVLPGLVAYAGWRGLTALADQDRNGAITLGTAVLILVGFYEFTPWKRSALAGCRQPYDVLWGAGGPWHDVRAGFLVGLSCVWANVGLVAVLVMVGVLNPGAMAAVAVAGLLAKNVPKPRPVCTLVGVVVIAFAILTAVFPEWLSVY
jgi:predicted metal-binding membrane protein